MSEPCACGDPNRPGLDHTRHVCVTSGLFGPEDFSAIEAAANKEDPSEPPHHAR